MSAASLLSILFSMHCSLSISFTSGHTQNCSAQIISEKKLLTAAHCLENESLRFEKDPLIIASCGNPRDKVFYIDSFLPFKTPDHITVSNDKSILDFSQSLNYPKNSPTVSQFKSLYFEVDGRLKKGTSCFAIGLDYRVILFNNIDLKYDKTDHSIESTFTESLSTAPRHTLIPGDSGSPLYCKSSYKNSSYELIAVTSKVKTSKEFPSLLLGNKFTPLF